jgi:hypothetical protein
LLKVVEERGMCFCSGCVQLSGLLRLTAKERSFMYNVLWTGSYLPLPEGSMVMPQQSNGWQPLFTSEIGFPSYWWFLVDHFNCFWRGAGTPVFLVERETALERCDSRFSFLKEAFSNAQQQAWMHFRDAIKMSRGDIFYIELSGVWQSQACGSTERFQAYTKDCLLPFEISSSRLRKQSTEQKKQTCATFLSGTSNETVALFGHRINPEMVRHLGPDAVL